MPRNDHHHDTGRTSLTPRSIVDGAIALADAEGLGAVTIRRLARELGVTPMALYWHVRNKDELLDYLAARLIEEVDLSIEASAPWQEQMRAVLASLIAVLRAHPAAASLVSTRSITSEAGLDATEVVLDILRRAGFSPSEATQIARHALSTVTNLVDGEPGVVVRGEPDASTDDRQRARDELASLSPERYPRLIEAATPLTEGMDPDTYFAFGLDLLLAGIDAMASRPR